MTNKILFLLAILRTSMSIKQAQNNMGICTNMPDADREAKQGTGTSSGIRLTNSGSNSN